jgi:predicted TIM-barrel fold metal-dependent hydrolase
MPVVDADTHVIETERTWEFIEEARYRPVLVATADAPNDQHWVVDGKLRRRAQLFRGPQAPRGPLGRNTATPEEAREMANLDLRLQHMDELGVDVQILHNTIFIEAVADRVESDVAICKSWNRWLADIWSRSNNRLRWSCVPPYSSINDALDEIRFAKQNGAVAVCMRPIEAENRTIADPYFYPLYEEAQRLDMAIAIHIANGNPLLVDAFRSPYDPGSAFGMFRAVTAVSCHTYIMSKLPQLFPTLRWGFIEASAQWVPWVSHEARRRYEASGKTFPSDVFKEYRIYVTCQTDDDIPYILKYSGHDSLMIGTDYGHTDPSSEVDAISIIKKRDDISADDLYKILDENPRRLYGI